MAKEEEFVMTPEEIAQCEAAPVLQPFIKDHNVDRDAVENFVKHGKTDDIPAMVSAMPTRLRAYLKTTLQNTFGVSIFKNGRELIKQL